VKGERPCRPTTDASRVLEGDEKSEFFIFFKSTLRLSFSLGKHYNICSCLSGTQMKYDGLRHRVSVSIDGTKACGKMDGAKICFIPNNHRNTNIFLSCRRGNNTHIDSTIKS